MSIEYVITRLNHAFLGLVTKRLSRHDVRLIQEQAMDDYQAWVNRISDDEKNNVMLFNNQINQILLSMQ